MTLTAQRDDKAGAEALIEKARAEAERRLVQIDVEEARAAGKTEPVVSTVATARGQ